MLKSPVIRYRSYWEHRLWLGDPKLLQDIFQAERDGLVEKPEFPPFHRVRSSSSRFAWSAAVEMYWMQLRHVLPAFVCILNPLKRDIKHCLREGCGSVPGWCSIRMALIWLVQCRPRDAQSGTFILTEVLREGGCCRGRS